MYGSACWRWARQELSLVERNRLGIWVQVMQSELERGRLHRFRICIRSLSRKTIPLNWIEPNYGITISFLLEKAAKPCKCSRFRRRHNISTSFLSSSTFLPRNTFTEETPESQTGHVIVIERFQCLKNATILFDNLSWVKPKFRTCCFGAPRLDD